MDCKSLIYDVKILDQTNAVSHKRYGYTVKSNLRFFGTNYYKVQDIIYKSIFFNLNPMKVCHLGS